VGESPTTEHVDEAVDTGPWSPFRQRAFAMLWTATVLSNIGTWMNDVGAGWLMTSLSPSPLMVAAVQAATTLPIFLFALPAGALADRMDRRRLLLVVNLLLALTAGLLSLAVVQGVMSAPLLLAFTFVLGTGAAFVAPAWQAVVPKLVPRPQLPAAIALNSMGINVSRAIGPALAGLLIASISIAAPFLLNALSFVAIVGALLLWRVPPAAARRLPPERMGQAIRAGLRYARHSGPLRATLIRALAFFLFASAYWALLPLVVRQQLQGGPSLYGVILGAVGVGAVSGALLLPSLRRRIGPNGTLTLGTLGTVVALLVFAWIARPAAAIAAALLAGASWIAVLSTLHVAAQTALPEWVRARGLSIFLTVFFGAMSLSSLGWGQLAALYGIATALSLAAAGAVLALLASFRVQLDATTQRDLAPSAHWPAPVAAGASHDRGPVLVQIEYRVTAAHRATVLRLLHALGAARRRNGAFDWGLMEDASDPHRLIEYFLEASWLQHLRHHERVTGDDRALQLQIRALLDPDDTPRVTHLLAPEDLT
jgi:MFS family permease